MCEVISPTEDEARALETAHAILAELAIPAGPPGDGLETLAAAVYAHQGVYAIDRVAGAYRAEIRPQAPGALAPRATEYGATAAAALVLALAAALTTTDRR